METPHQITTTVCIFCLAWALAVQANDPPAAKPTPRPGTLAALAGSTTLNRSPGTARTGVIVITDDNLTTLSQGAALTVMTSTIAEPAVVDAGDQANPTTRENWRRKVMAASAAIAELEARRDSVKAEINRLGRGKLDGRTLDRIAKAEGVVRAIETEIKGEKAQLARIIRQARKEGAQPGWFR